MNKGIVTKNISGVYTVKTDGVYIDCVGRGRIKQSDKILVGDNVLLDNNIIVEIQPRTNKLVRPPVANIDKLLILIAPTPKPDFLLVDKLIIMADMLKITPVLIFNKSDLCDENIFIELQNEYRKTVECIVNISTVTKQNSNKIKDIISGYVCCLAGQSAVGKSSLLNQLTESDEAMQTGELSKRASRGKHTTRHCEAFEIDDALIIDTPGFSLLENFDFCIDDSDFYYKEFFDISGKCKFNRCTHTKEPDCAVKKAVENKELSKNRYDRYLKLRNELIEQKNNKY